MAKNAKSGRARSGGGIAMNKNRSVGQRVAPRTTNVINPAQPDYLGQQTAFAKGGFVKRKAPDFAPMGNTLTNNVGKGGPGTGRTLHGQSGSQGCHGPVTGTVRYGADILKDYGPEKSKG
jgi:hypothetical protein